MIYRIVKLPELLFLALELFAAIMEGLANMQVDKTRPNAVASLGSVGRRNATTADRETLRSLSSN